MDEPIRPKQTIEEAAAVRPGTDEREARCVECGLNESAGPEWMRCPKCRRPAPASPPPGSEPRELGETVESFKRNSRAVVDYIKAYVESAPVSAQGGAAAGEALRWRAHALANEHLDVCVVRPGVTTHGVFCDSVLAALARIREEARAEALREAAAVVGEYARQLQVNSTVGIEAFWAAKEAVERVERLAASTGGGRDEGDEMSDRWRVGRTLGRTLYLDGHVCGMVDTPEMAAAIVAAMNATSPAAAEPIPQGTPGVVEPRVNDVWHDSIDDKDWTLLRRDDSPPMGWHTESEPGADNGFLVDRTFAIPGRLTFVRRGT